VVLEALRRKVWDLARERRLAGGRVQVVSARPLTPEAAIGRPDWVDFPILKGKEVMIEASFRGSRGQAFTAMPGEYCGTLEEVLGRPLAGDFDRALVVATVNAVLRHMGLANGTVHCRDEGPKECAARLLDYLTERFGSPRVAVIGLQPALVAALSGRLPVRVTDLDLDNVGRVRAGVRVSTSLTKVILI